MHIAMTDSTIKKEICEISKIGPKFPKMAQNFQKGQKINFVGSSSKFQEMLF